LKSFAKRNTIILISDKSVFNPDTAITYQNISAEYSIYLNTLLISNWVEISAGLKAEYNLITFIDSRDEEHLPKYFLPDDFNLIYYQKEQMENFVEKYVRSSIDQGSNCLLIFCNTIGVTINDVARAFSLLQSDEPSIVIGRSIQNQITFICASDSDAELMDFLFSTKRNFQEYLKLISARDIYIHTLDKFFSINDFQDIKKLYIELSKKESLSYCSQKMHESFNDLFIEYKELLNA